MRELNDVARKHQAEFLTGDITAELLHDASAEASVNGGWGPIMPPIFFTMPALCFPQTTICPKSYDCAPTNPERPECKPPDPISGHWLCR